LVVTVSLLESALGSAIESIGVRAVSICTLRAIKPIYPVVVVRELTILTIAIFVVAISIAVAIGSARSHPQKTSIAVAAHPVRTDTTPGLDSRSKDQILTETETQTQTKQYRKAEILEKSHLDIVLHHN